ncbi:MAG: chemotaxis protein CheW [Gemmatimonadales bacterium]
MDAPQLSWVPRAAEGLVGQVRHRGRTLSAFDAGWLFSVRRTAEATTALVLRDGDARVAVIVDDVEDLQLVEPESLRPVPAGTDPEGVLRGVSRAPARERPLMGLVNVDALLARTRGPAAPARANPR